MALSWQHGKMAVQFLQTPPMKIILSVKRNYSHHLTTSSVQQKFAVGPRESPTKSTQISSSPHNCLQYSEQHRSYTSFSKQTCLSPCLKCSPAFSRTSDHQIHKTKTKQYISLWQTAVNSTPVNLINTAMMVLELRKPLVIYTRSVLACKRHLRDCNTS